MPESVHRNYDYNRYLSAAMPLRILAVEFFFDALTGSFGEVLQSFGHTRAVMWISVTGTCSNLLMMIILVPSFGVVGASLSMTMSLVVMATMGLLILKFKKQIVPFSRDYFNLVLLSHALEHTPNPVDVVNEMKAVTKKWLVLAVPNPIRPKILMKYGLSGRDYSNKGHYYSWDRSHFQNLLTSYCGLEIVKWATDDVRVIPFKGLRAVFRAVRVLDWLETKFLARCFPYFSSSLIVLCKKRTGQ